jgi:hypothetical protein
VLSLITRQSASASAALANSFIFMFAPLMHIYIRDANVKLLSKPLTHSSTGSINLCIHITCFNS